MHNHHKQHPYQGRRVALATKHGKEQQIARPLRVALDLQVDVPEALDTDVLGTFTGEVPRPGAPGEVVLQKARMGMQATGLPRGLANEGSFGIHPQLPFLLANTELLLFVDDERGIQVQEHVVSEQTNAAQCTTRSIDDLSTFLPRSLFPSHALIVHPNAVLLPELIFKGITDAFTLADAIKRCADASPDKLALVATDLRAHMNPTRRRVIRRLAFRLARRLAHLCSQCGAPGWGRVDVVRGLPCEWCGEPTDLVREEIFGCPCCTYRAHTPRADGMLYAPAGQCSQCNP